VCCDLCEAETEAASTVDE
jgi:pimeloyl-ACP methyl ester carboxylesterase